MFCVLDIEMHELFVYFGDFIWKYFLPFWKLSSCLVYGFLCYTKVLSLIRSHLFVFLFITVGGQSKKILLWFMSKCVLPLFSSKSFRVSGLMFRSLIHFEVLGFFFLCVYDVVTQFSEHHTSQLRWAKQNYPKKRNQSIQGRDRY